MMLRRSIFRQWVWQWKQGAWYNYGGFLGHSSCTFFLLFLLQYKIKNFYAWNNFLWWVWQLKHSCFFFMRSFDEFIYLWVCLRGFRLFQWDGFVFLFPMLSCFSLLFLFFFILDPVFMSISKRWECLSI